MSHPSTLSFSLRHRILVALASSGLLAGCGGEVQGPSQPADASSSPKDAETDATPATPKGDADVDRAPLPFCTSGRESTQCFTHAGLESMLRAKPRGYVDAGEDAADPVPTAPWDPNGCLPPSHVANDCCNPASFG